MTDSPTPPPLAARDRSGRRAARRPVGVSRRIRIGGTAAVVLVLGCLALAALGAATRAAGETTGMTLPLEGGGTGSGSPTSEGSMSDASTTDPSTHGAGGATAPGGEEIYVHVLGAVHTPGLFTLSADARVVDAIAAAGGFTADADTGSVNLARAVADGEQLVVRRPGEVPPPQADASGGTGASGGAPGPTTPIPLNSASAAELESLPRIGPALAERIVQWRTDNGPFRLVDELLQVPGIGEAILAGLEGLVTT